jgi:hypothetical protein
MNRVRLFHNTLVEEMTGKLFRMSQLIEVPSISDDAFSAGLQESDYLSKMAIVGKFISDLKMAEQAVFPGDLSPNKSEVFTCTRFLLNQAISNFSLALTRWQAQKSQELQYHYNSLSLHAIQLLQQKDEEIGRYKAMEKELKDVS